MDLSLKMSQHLINNMRFCHRIHGGNMSRLSHYKYPVVSRWQILKRRLEQSLHTICRQRKTAHKHASLMWHILLKCRCCTYDSYNSSRGCHMKSVALHVWFQVLNSALSSNMQMISLRLILNFLHYIVIITAGENNKKVSQKHHRRNQNTT